MSTPNRTEPSSSPPAGRLGLSRERIAQAALDLVDREGLDAVSMRRLARELGAGTMTIYGYFDGKDDLLDAVVDAAAERHRVSPPRGPWRERLAAVIRAMRHGLAEHPSLIQLRLRRPLLSPGAMRGTEIGLEALHEAGFDPHEAARAFRVLFLYAFGFTAFSVGEVSDELRAEVRSALGDLPSAEYPAVVASLDHMPETLGGEEQFELGLEVILDGLEARLSRR